MRICTAGSSRCSGSHAPLVAAIASWFLLLLPLPGIFVAELQFHAVPVHWKSTRRHHMRSAVRTPCAQDCASLLCSRAAAPAPRLTSPRVSPVEGGQAFAHLQIHERKTIRPFVLKPSFLAYTPLMHPIPIDPPMPQWSVQLKISESLGKLGFQLWGGGWEKSLIDQLL